MDEFISVDLEDFEAERKVLPAGPTTFEVKTTEVKQKDEPGSYPYIECRLEPFAYLYLSFHPKAAFNIGGFLRDGLAYKGEGVERDEASRKVRLDPKKIAEGIRGMRFGAQVGVEKDTRSEDPEAKRNTVGPKYFRA